MAKCSESPWLVFVFDLRVQHHFAAIGKLDGVPQQIHDHLPQASGISDNIERHIRMDVADKFQTF